MDDFERAGSSFGLQGLLASAAPPTFDELEAEHPALVSSLSAFRLIDTAALVAALMSYPQFHANTIRLELLQSFVLRHAKGRNVPTRNRIATWLNVDLAKGWAARMEDPVEDVFVSNVITSIGNSRIFEGIWEANDYWLQYALDAARACRSEDWADEALGRCFTLLKLGDLAAKRCELERYSMGNGYARAGLQLPAQSDLLARSQRFRFPRAQLDELGVTTEDLAPFIDDASAVTGGVGKSSLERHPLLADGDGVLLALPTAISPAIRFHIAESALRAGRVERYEQLLFDRQLDSAVHEGAQRLGGTPVETPVLPDLPTNAQARSQKLVRFDTGRFAHFIFLEDGVLEPLANGLTSILDFGDEKYAALLTHIQECAELLAAQPDYGGGLTVGVIGGLGRSFVLPVRQPPTHWHASVFRLPDFVAAGRAHDTDFLSLWRLEEQEAILQARGVRMLNVNGQLNLLGFLRDSDQRLVPRDTPASGAMLHIGTDFIAGIRRDLRAKYDLHAASRRAPNVWVPVRRYNVNPFFKELTNDRIYVDDEAIRRGRLRAVVETDNRHWWLSALQRPALTSHRDMQIRIWEATLWWMAKIAPVAEAFVSAIPPGPVEILLRLEGFSGWTSQSMDDLPAQPEEPSLAVQHRLVAVQVTLPLAFVRYFAVPLNVGERKIIRSIFEGICALSATSLPPSRLDELVQRVVRNDDARFFHIAYAQDHRQQMASLRGGKPRFVKNSEVNFACLGLSQRVLGRADVDTVSGPQETNRFLHAVVDDVWDRIRTLLQTLSRRSVIEMVLANVENIESDKEQWRLTASAQLATHEDQEDVERAAREREHDRAGAGLASRVLIEMAVCTCAETGGTSFSNAVFDELLGLIRLLLDAASSSDAVRSGLTAPEVTIYNNGEFSVDSSYAESVIAPYAAAGFSQQFTAAAAAYHEYYRDPRAQKDEIAAPGLPATLVNAFESEFSITPEQLVMAVHVLEREAANEGKLVLCRTTRELTVVLEREGITSHVVHQILSHFALWPRGPWDRTPAGFAATDWYPWRYRRRLSLLTRPFVRINADVNATYIFAPALLSDCLELLITRLMTGDLPSELFKSAAMQSWVGDAVRRRGKEFEHEVADELEKIGLFVGRSIPMSQFGADESYGDLDVFAWSADGSVFYAVECKRLRFARTVAEIAEQLREFRGEEMDRLARHLRRCEWLVAHPNKVRQVTGSTSPQPDIVPLLVTNAVVPMQFTEGLPIAKENVVPLASLARWVHG